jgi:DNA polymerase-3 subunit delta
MPSAKPPAPPPAPPVVAIVGTDSFLQLSALADVLRLLPVDAGRADFDGETANLADVLDEARSYSMFGGGKAVIVRNADPFLKTFREQLEDYVTAPSDSATLIFRLNALPSNQRIYKAIQKIGRIDRCDMPKDLARWVIDRGKTAHKLSIAPDAARVLVDHIGDDLGRLDNELAKLALSSPSTTITSRDIDGFVAFQREREMWDLTASLAGGDCAAAITRWRQLVQLESSAEFRAVTWLGLWLENVTKALDMLSRNHSPASIGQSLRIWPRELDAFLHTAKRMGKPGVRRAVDLLAQIDYQIKTGVGDATSNVERFILTLATDKAK